jgi:hypothetical protein
MLSPFRIMITYSLIVMAQESIALLGRTLQRRLQQAIDPFPPFGVHRRSRLGASGRHVRQIHPLQQRAETREFLESSEGWIATKPDDVGLSGFNQLMEILGSLVKF